MSAEQICPQERVYAKKLHLLVHPGYRLFSGGQAGAIETEDKKTKELFDLYIAQVRTIADRTSETRSEIMFVFHVATSRMLQERTHEHTFLIRQYREMQRLLQKRIFFLSDIIMEAVSDSADKYGPVFDRARCMARDAGYSFRKDSVDTEAYGEAIGSCVPSLAHSFNAHFDLKNPTTIITGLTSLHSLSDEALEEIKLYLARKQEKYHRAVYDCI